MRNTPIFRYTLIAAALSLSAPAFGLGLGKLTVTSGLGEPLSAQIELTSASREELDSLTARVADPSVYRQNNLTYQAVLNRARVSVERTPDGRAYLRVTSPVAATEPYLDLLVDVNWASGRVVREYTFLLDPPGSTQLAQQAEPVTPARGGSPVPPRTAPRAAPETRVAAAPAATAPAPAAPAPAAREPAAAPADGYVVKRGDTLSKIAQQFKAPSVSLDQMLVALFNANAGAFDGNNMNRLRTGAIMSVPSADEVATTPPNEAAKVVRAQASDWRAYRDRVAATAPVGEAGESRQASSGRITTAIEDKAAPSRAGGDQVRVSREAGLGKGGATAAAEDAVAKEKALREANARVAELEKMLKDAQRALELRNQSMASAQQAAEAAKAKSAPPVVAPPVPATTVAKAPEPPKVAEPVKAPEPPKVEAPKVEPPKAEAPKVEPPKAEPPKPEAPKVETAKAEAPKPAEPIAAAPPPAPKPAEPPKAAPKAAPKAPAPEPSFLEELTAGTPTWAIGAGALAVLGGIAAIIAARRRKTTKFEDSIISGTDIKTNTVFGSTGGGVVNTGDNSLASDFSREGLGNIDTDEVDPIAEAEVYLAYGRDAQAEEILKDALKKDPQRQEIYLKLLEIHAQHNKPSAFETVASELYSVTSGQGEVWQKATALGRQLDPNNPMFAEGGAPSHKAPMHDDEPTVTMAAARATGARPLPTGGDKELDFQLDEDITVAPSSGVKPKAHVDAMAGAGNAVEQSVQRAEAAVDAASEKSRAAAAGAVAALAGTLAASKSSLDNALSGVGASIDTAKKEAPEFGMEFALDESEKPAPMGKPRATAPALAEAAPSLARPAAALELDKLDLSFDPDRTTFEDPTPSVLDGQWHDAATKLDLAKAYQEMGDVEGAREILQEVLHEGDDQQKTEAQSLLTKLG
jgi:pilus assembly protein FimV